MKYNFTENLHFPEIINCPENGTILFFCAYPISPIMPY